MTGQKRGRGQPRKITPHIARKIFVLYGKGLTDHEIAEVFDLNRDTLTELKKQAEYSVTIRSIKEDVDKKVIASLYQRAIGQYVEDKAFCHEGQIVIGQIFNHPPSEGACMMWLMNRRRNEWRKESGGEDAGKQKPPMVRIFENSNGREMAVITRGDNQVDVLLGKEFVDQIKLESNGNQTDTNGNVRF